MVHMKILLDADDGSFDHLADRPCCRVSDFTVSGLSRGMASGSPSVSFIVEDLGDGRWLLAETSLKLFLTAADALRARYGDPRLPGFDPTTPSPS